MTKLNWQNRFTTNPTSDVSAEATTTPLDDIPSVAAPFFLVYDPENTYSHYEVVYVTSKSSTNVNHAALTYEHSTAEEVRMAVPAEVMNMLDVDHSIAFPLSAAVGDGSQGFAIPSWLNGYNLTSVLLAVKTPGTTDTMDIQVRRAREGSEVNMLSSALSLPESDYSVETDDEIDTDNDDLATGDMVYVDVDAVHGTPAEEPTATLTVTKPIT